MDKNQLMKARQWKRKTLMTVIKQVEEELTKDAPDRHLVAALAVELEANNDAIVKLNQEIEQVMTIGEVNEKEQDEEVDSCASFRKAYQVAKAKTVPLTVTEPTPSEASVSSVATQPGGYEAYQMYTLPKNEVPKFSGEIKDWLRWWARYKRIHEDARLSGAEKYSILIEAVADSKRARDLVDKCAPTDENYPKIIASLTRKFGDTEQLIDYYVRAFHQLLINTIQNKYDKNKDKITATYLFDNIETSLNALDSLGEIDKSQWLFPTIESSLPYGLMCGWQRSQYYKSAPGEEPRSKHDRLLDFLREESANEDRRAMAVSGFTLHERKTAAKEESRQPPRKKAKWEHRRNDVPTAMGLVALTGSDICIFCGKHSKSHKCKSSDKMSKPEKEKKIKDARVCFRCFERGHYVRECSKDIPLCPKCKKENHYPINCYPKESYNTVPPPLFPSAAPKTPDASSTPGQMGLANFHTSPDVFMPTLMVGVHDARGKIHKLRAAIDTMSGHTYITRKAVENLQIFPSKANILFRHSVFGGGSKHVPHNLYELKLCALDWSYTCDVKVYDQEQIATGIPPVPNAAAKEELRKLNIHLSDSNPSQIELLIGSGLAAKLWTGQQLELECGLTAFQTNFGWTLMGEPLQLDHGFGGDMVEHAMINMDYPHCLWQLQAIGIEDQAEKLSKEEENQAIMEHFRKNVKRDHDGRYTVALPWLKGHPPLLSNRKIAETRLDSATRKLNRDGMFLEYEAQFEDWLKEGIISEVFPSEKEDGTHYLPHRPVYKMDSNTTKVRPVFDASCRGVSYTTRNEKTETPSLNDCLFKGPNLLDQIPDILLRFREEKVAAVADIRKAFLMVQVKEEDRKYLRFLWWKGQYQKTYRVFQHNRVVFGVNCSPFLLNAVIDHHLTETGKNGYQSTIGKLKASLYVDNVAASFPDPACYERFRRESVEIMQQGQFDLRLWEANSDPEIGPEPTGVLGLKWNRLTDELFCHILPKPNLKDNKVTKKRILSAHARMYDPLGILAAVSMEPKIEMQRCWELKLKWDQEVPDDIAQRFLKWEGELVLINQARISRYIGKPTPGSSVHVFSDASKLGYAAVVYLRLVEGDDVSIKFVICRARVTPIKKPEKPDITINRLELTACEVATRLVFYVVKVLGWNNIPVHLWTDSSCALAWIERDRDWGTYVGNRVRKIRALTSADQWHHVPGHLNPADLPSRGCGMKELLESKWLEGPMWLAKDSQYWPGGEFFFDETAIEAELRKTDIVAVNACFPLDEPWYSTWKCRLGTWKDIVRIMAHILRLSQTIRSRPVRVWAPLSFEEMQRAEKRVFKMIQKEHHFDLDKLPFRTVPRDKSLKLLCVETKLAYRDEFEDFIYPVLLPGDHYLTKLLIKQEHDNNSHAGVQFLMAHLREKVWIHGGRRAIAKVIHECQVCRRYAVQHPDPPAPPLPEARVRDAFPFEVTGVDLAGPFYLKGGGKCWMVLYTCGHTRAIHIELVDDLSTEAILSSKRQFIARRGRPSVIYSDRGTNFVGASNKLKEIDWEKIENDDALKAIKWIFNAPAAPWWGGWWEVLVGLVKDLAVRQLGQYVVTKEELMVIMCDVEMTINNRPLTYVYENDTFAPITPAMFLYGPRSQGYPDLDQLDIANPVKRLRYRQQLMEQLRDRFRKEYLGQLVQRRKKTKDIELHVGDVVLIEVDNVKRTMWPMGVITEAIASPRDGIKRTFKIRTKRGEITRPIQRLYPMELTQSYINSTPENVKQQLTRTGRISRRPDRLDL